MRPGKGGNGESHGDRIDIDGNMYIYIYWMFRCGHEVQGGMSHSPQVPVPYAIEDSQDPEDLDLLAEADA